MFRRRYGGPTASAESERREAETAANAARLLRWVAVSRARALLASVDRAAAEACGPGLPTLVSAFDEMRRWK